MNRKVKRYDPISSDGTCGMCIEDADFGAYVEYEDFAALEAECDSLWSTYVALVDKLDIDTEKAKTAYGKPSDVIVSYVDKLRAENDRLRAERDAFRDSRNYLIEEISDHLSEIAELRDALEEIADPIKFMRARLEDGEQLNWVYAIQMAESGNYLREIAKRALAASTEQEVESE